MKPLKIVLLAIIALTLHWSVRAQTISVEAYRKNLLITDTDRVHSITVQVFRKRKLQSTVTIAPGGAQYAEIKTIASPKDIKKFTYRTIYDEAALNMDQQIRTAKMVEAKRMRDSGAMEACINRIRREAFFRSLFGVLLGDWGKAIVAGFDLKNLDLEKMHTIERVQSNMEIFEEERTQLEKNIRYTINQFRINREADPFDYCPNLESSILAYNREYLRYKHDTTLEAYYAQNKPTKVKSSDYLLANAVNKAQRKSLRASQPAVFATGSFYLGPGGGSVGGDLGIGYSPFRTHYGKKGRTGRLYFTAGLGTYLRNFEPEQITGLVDTLNNKKYYLPINTAVNNSFFQFRSDYAMLGIKATTTKKALSFGIEGGVSYTYKRSYQVSSKEYFEEVGNELVPFDLRIKERPLISDARTIFTAANLDPYWGLEIKYSLKAAGNKPRPHRGTLFVGGVISGRPLANKVNTGIIMENLSIRDNKIVSVKPDKTQFMPLGVGLSIGLQF